jgi:hypothetical protein
MEELETEQDTKVYQRGHINGGGLILISMKDIQPLFTRCMAHEIYLCYAKIPHPPW